MRNKSVKIGFQNIGPQTWQAGTVYFQNLFGALRDTFTDEFTLSFVITNESEGSSDSAEIADEVLSYHRPPRWTVKWAIDRCAVRWLGYELLLDRFLKENNVQVMAFGIPPDGSKIPTLGFVPDFQHLHLPEMFSETERRSRDAGYMKTIQKSGLLVLLSETVKRDLELFAGEHVHKARVLKPVANIPPSTYEGNPTDLLKCLSLPLKFIYFPGQFWKHKNHSRVFLALKTLKDRGVRLYLACSGYPGDLRHPNYYSEVLTQISEYGLRDQVAMLGSLTRVQVFTLMRQAICVLSPSLFEGFGMTVDEARSIGKSLLLSDIPAHREQDPPHATYFDPSDAQDLADKLEQMWAEHAPGPDLDLENEARTSLPARRKNYAEGFRSIIRELVPERTHG